MTEKQENLSDDKFKMIFSYKIIRELLLIDIASYPFIYYFMNYFITNKLYEKGESSPPSPKKHLGSFKFNNIITLLKTSLYYIKTSLDKTETFKGGLDILFLSRDRFIDIKTENGLIKSDYLFGSIIHDINERYPNCKMAIVGTTFKHMPKIDDIGLHSLIQYSTPVILLRSALFSLIIYLRWKLSRSKIINYLKDNDCEYGLFLFDNFYNLRRLFYLLIFDYSLKNVLKKTNPKAIASNDDVLNLKPKINLESTKLIIMQSASMDETNEKFKKMFISNFPLDKLIADYFLVSGTKFKDMKKDVKDSKEIKVTGQPRYDVLYHADKFYSKEKFLKKYKINPKHKIILWATQCHSLNDEENIKNFKAVFGVMQSLKDATLIIKQHPGEGKKYRKMIETYLNQYGINAVVTPKDSDTHEQLFVCNLMLARHSTTAMEAVALNKAVIILNLSGEPDPVEYVKEGVALGVYKEGDLKTAIEELLRDDSELAKNRMRYIEKYLYKIDGKATERVVKLIGEMINENQKRDEK